VREADGLCRLCDPCGEEIAVANDLDRAGDIYRDRRVVMVAGVTRRLMPKHWRLFVLLYINRGDVVLSDRAYDALYRGIRNPPPPRIIGSHISHLRRTLGGSRYEIIGHLGIVYRMVVTDQIAEEVELLDRG
jgi:DNA-binding response OmpR family regulator